MTSGRPANRIGRITDWVGRATGASSVTLGPDLAGATTATITTGEMEAPDGTRRRFVVKIYDRGLDGVGGGDVERDAAAMQAAGEVGVAAPRMLATDPEGVHVGWPAIAMTRPSGSPRAHGGSDPHGWVDGLADALVAIGTAARPTVPLPGYQHWFTLPLEVPDWATDPGPWRELDALLGQPLPQSAARFIHRDFHQLNVLWNDATPTATVDWVNGCLGPIESDIASGRVNIALADVRSDGVALADRFLLRCRAAGLPWHPLWDAEFVAGVAARPEVFLVGVELGARLDRRSVCRTLETMLRRALDAAAADTG